MTDIDVGFAFDNSFARELGGLYEPWTAVTSPAPQLLAVNDALAVELGIDPDWVRSPRGGAVLCGNETPAGAAPLAQAYAGHQFGSYNPRLGDGRALLVGELVDAAGRRRDLHLKGSGRTPFARGGDGRAAVGPMLREYVVGEAMHALGIPTTRALAVVATGEDIARDTMVPGAVLARIASSHLRVGTFQYASALEDPTVLRRLADHAIARHYPQAAAASNPYLALYEAVLDAQASLVARWMLVGFVHGVMNTDNMTISGETIDYGPCAFLDAFDPATVFSSIDHRGRYAFANQPPIAQWNLARLAEAMLPILAADQETAVAAATDALGTFGERYDRVFAAGMRAKIGLPADDGDAAPDDALIDELLAILHEHRLDFTGSFRSLANALRASDTTPVAVPGATGPNCDAADSLAPWVARWRDRVTAEGRDANEVAAAMDRVNPVYIPRNHQVEAALAAASTGDLAPFGRLVDVVTHPFDERPDALAFALPAPASDAPYRTFCGT